MLINPNALDRMIKWIMPLIRRQTLPGYTGEKISNVCDAASGELPSLIRLQQILHNRAVF